MRDRISGFLGRRTQQAVKWSEFPASSPTESWSNPAGWSIDIPVGWAHDSTNEGAGQGWVPTTGLGRLSVLTIRSREAVQITPEFARQHAERLARALGLPQPGPDQPVESLSPGHLGMSVEGWSGGRQTYALIHVFDPGVIACASWHTAAWDDADSADGIAAARSLAPTRRVDEHDVTPSTSGDFPAR
jgi:hypothetical protein